MPLRKALPLISSVRDSACRRNAPWQLDAVLRTFNSIPVSKQVVLNITIKVLMRSKDNDK